MRSLPRITVRYLGGWAPSTAYVHLQLPSAPQMFSIIVWSVVVIWGISVPSAGLFFLLDSQSTGDSDIS
ncbi:MAG: hypothetical protein AAFX06_23890 [Planctomycetota bacterium]